jgi:hypothetical protein
MLSSIVFRYGLDRIHQRRAGETSPDKHAKREACAAAQSAAEQEPRPGAQRECMQRPLPDARLETLEIGQRPRFTCMHRRTFAD